MKICKKCHRPNQDDANFCAWCRNQEFENAPSHTKRLVKANIKMVIVFGTFIMLVLLLNSCTAKTVVGTWQGHFTYLRVQRDGAISGSFLGDYYGMHISKTEFNNHSFTISYASNYDQYDAIVRENVYEYTLEHNKNSLVILSNTTIEYGNGVELSRSVTKNEIDWVLTRRN